MQRTTMNEIRAAFVNKLAQGKFTSVNREASMTALAGSTTIELVGASFLANEDSLFGEVNWDYVHREEEWYKSMSLSVNAIPGGPPAVWKAVADADGYINSNYGWAIYHAGNYQQYERARDELRKNPESRRAIMIYTRPSMWLDYNKNGRSDFMCTNEVQYLLRDDMLHAVVSMRSNDAIFGFKNDRAWQMKVLTDLADELGYPVGDLIWNVGSLHVYARHYYLVHHYGVTLHNTADEAELHISLADYKKKYPNSPYIPA